MCAQFIVFILFNVQSGVSKGGAKTKQTLKQFQSIKRISHYQSLLF